MGTGIPEFLGIPMDWEPPKTCGWFDRFWLRLRKPIITCDPVGASSKNYYVWKRLHGVYHLIDCFGVTTFDLRMACW